MRERLPTIRVAGAEAEALTLAVLARLDGEPLARFLAERRWFGGKGSAVGTARVAAALPLDVAPLAALAIVEVSGPAGHGAPVHYQVPLVLRRVDDPPARAGGPVAVLARVESADGEALLFDATEDAVFRRGLGAAFARGGHAGAGWIAEPVGAGAAAADADSRLLAGEQSNTSIVYGDAVILKLFRRLEAGEHPDVEIARFLAARSAFRHTPALLGVLRLAAANGERAGEEWVAGMLQHFVPGSRDAWAHALDRAADYFAGRANAGAFAADAAQLGRVTRELHEALAAGAGVEAFAPVEATSADVARWADAAGRAMHAALALLAGRVRDGALAVPAQEEAHAVLARRDALDALVERAAAAVSGHAGLRIRHHGDYHLGQVLRAPDGTFYVIDFEGEPARPLAHRRERTSALRDVAGMVRSFAYAAAVGAAAAGAGPGADVDSLADRAAQWEGAARAAFLDAYLAPGQAPFLPDGAAGVALLTLFELEKLFYELAYELNNRPAWAPVPLRGVARLLRTAPAPHRDSVGRR